VQGLLAAGDSSGVVRVRTGEFGCSWVPVFSSAAVRTSEAEKHWLVGLTAQVTQHTHTKHILSTPYAHTKH
jgi:chromosome transmission fidelity protein 4